MQTAIFISDASEEVLVSRHATSHQGDWGVSKKGNRRRGNLTQAADVISAVRPGRGVRDDGGCDGPSFSGPLECSSRPLPETRQRAPVEGWSATDSPSLSRYS